MCLLLSAVCCAVRCGVLLCASLGCALTVKRGVLPHPSSLSCSTVLTTSSGAFSYSAKPRMRRSIAAASCSTAGRMRKPTEDEEGEADGITEEKEVSSRQRRHSHGSRLMRKGEVVCGGVEWARTSTTRSQDRDIMMRRTIYRAAVYSVQCTVYSVQWTAAAAILTAVEHSVDVTLEFAHFHSLLSTAASRTAPTIILSFHCQCHSQPAARTITPGSTFSFCTDVSSLVSLVFCLASFSPHLTSSHLPSEMCVCPVLAPVSSLASSKSVASELQPAEISQPGS